MASVGALLDQITFEIPLKEALQYPKGKEKWTRADIKVRSGEMMEGWRGGGAGVIWKRMGHARCEKERRQPE
jgi:hypothetical protein